MRIEEPNGDILVPPIVEETVEVVHSLPQERLQQRTLEERGESVQIIQERVQQSIEEQIVDAPLAEQVPVIEHVTPAPDSVHTASAPVVGYLAPGLEPSSSSAAHAAATKNDDIHEKLTRIINMFDSKREIFSLFECGSSSSTAAHAAPEQAPSKRR